MKIWYRGDVNLERENSSDDSRRVRNLPKRFDDYIMLFLSVHDVDVPKSYKEAVSSEKADKWREAMDKEMRAMKENNVWDLVDSYNGQGDIVTCHWVYSLKVSLSLCHVLLLRGCG